MKKLILIFILLSFAIVNAQEADVMPQPVGGIMAIANNVVYPQAAKDQKTEGKVMIKAIISDEGNVLKVEILKGIGNGCDEAAVEAIKKTAFTPAEKNGKKIKAEVVIPVKFKLCDEEKS